MKNLNKNNFEMNNNDKIIQNIEYYISYGTQQNNTQGTVIRKFKKLKK